MSERRKRQRDERRAREAARRPNEALDAAAAQKAKAAEQPVPAAFLAQVAEIEAEYAQEEPPPLHVADQWQAAGQEIDKMFTSPTPPFPMVKGKGTRRAFAYAVAAQRRCQPCVHLQATPQQPGFLFLGLRRALCQPCVAALPAGLGGPDVTAADECDMCTRRGVQIFNDVIFHGITGYVMTGNVCDDCSAVLAAAET